MRDKVNATWRLIWTLIRLGVAKDRSECWGFRNNGGMRDAVKQMIERLELKEEELGPEGWHNNIVDALPLEVTFTTSVVYVDEYDFYDDMENLQIEAYALKELNLHLRSHQSNQVPSTFGPRCRCQSPGAFAIDSS